MCTYELLKCVMCTPGLGSEEGGGQPLAMQCFFKVRRRRRNDDGYALRL